VAPWPFQSRCRFGDVFVEDQRPEFCPKEPIDSDGVGVSCSHPQTSKSRGRISSACAATVRRELAPGRTATVLPSSKSGCLGPLTALDSLSCVLADLRLWAVFCRLPAAFSRARGVWWGSVRLAEPPARRVFRYRGCVLAKIGAQIPPLTPGKWLIGVSIPLLGGWTTAAATSKTDVFIGPFFWVFIYMLVWGIGLFAWGAVTTPISPPKRTLHERPGAAKYSISRFKDRDGLGLPWAVVFEELVLGVAFYFLFSAFVGR
jgi:hypothetical protein